MSTVDNAIVSGSLTAAAPRINTRSAASRINTRSTNASPHLPPVHNLVLPASNNQNVESDLSMALSSKLTSIDSSVDASVEQIPKTFEEDTKDDIRDGGDSDIEGDEYEIHKAGLVKVEDDATELDELDMRGEYKDIVDLTGTGGMNVIGKVSVASTNSATSPEGKYKDVKIYRTPEDWVDPPAQSSRGEPKFEDIDNPGCWSRYVFRPSFASRSKTSKYKHHALPTGCQAVPKNVNGKREINGWQFYYQGWKNEAMPYRHGATTSNMFPKEMEGCLDADILRKLGLTKGRIEMRDSLFFYQLILPICNTQRSGIHSDPRKSYYCDVEKFTNMSKAESGYGGSYGHKWTSCTAAECVKFDGVVIMDGVQGSSNGAMFRRWDEDSCCFNKKIHKEMRYSRFKDLKSALKLCHNGSEPNRGQENYDPAYKYDLIYQAMIHNTNAITKYANENQTMDETTWGHGGYGEAGSGLVSRLRNKKVNKGGQTVLVSDSGKYFRPRAYQHRHKLHKMPALLSRQGSRELYDIANELLLLVIDDKEEGMKKIFRKKPCITVDNYFVCDKVLHWAGIQGLGVIGTNARNLLPKDIPLNYLCTEKVDSTSNVTKVARFSNPVVAVKDNDGYQRVHVTFQSTSSCNIASVNALNECRLFVEIRERGTNANKRQWGIEMNHARRLYLSTYGRIDSADHLLKNAAIFYRTWKYWHAAKNHAIALAIVIAYGVYQECCEGLIESEWKIDKKDVMDYFQFREKLAMQMLSYTPKNENYPGDEYMRAVTSTPRANRASKSTHSRGEDDCVSPSQYSRAKKYKSSRLCGDLGKLCHHTSSIIRLKKPRICAWCGENTYTMCGVCKDTSGKTIPLHYNSKKDTMKSKLCFYHYHDDMKFGLGRNDSTQVLNGIKSQWIEPDKSTFQNHSKHIKAIRK